MQTAYSSHKDHSVQKDSDNLLEGYEQKWWHIVLAMLGPLGLTLAIFAYGENVLYLTLAALLIAAGVLYWRLLGKRMWEYQRFVDLSARQVPRQFYNL
jgi:hypothetical protein